VTLEPPVDPATHGRLRRLASAVYRGSLLVLPSRFRDRFGTDLLRDFDEETAAAEARRGGLGVMGVLAAAVIDVARRAPVERWHVGRRGRPGPRERSRMTMETWGREIRAAARGLARRPGFSAVIVLTLALGIGANVAIFTVVDGVLLEPLAFPEPERMVSVRHHAPGVDLPEIETSLGMVNVYNRWARSLEAMAAIDDDSRNLTGGDRPDRVQVLSVSEPFFRVARTAPAIGRSFTAEDAAPGATPVAILTHGAWTGRFGREPGIIGRTVRVDGVPTEVIGVMPPEYAFPDAETALLLPLYVPEDATFGTFGRVGIARLAEGVTFDEARREVEALQARIPEYDAEMTPEFFEQAGWSVTVETLRDRLVGDARASLWIVLGTAGFVLLIACANVANLFLVRADARQREVAIRAALGAGRGRLAVAFLSESLLLGVLAGAAGVGMAAAGVRALVRWGPPELPRLHEIGMDGSVLLFAGAVSVLAGLAFGGLPVARYLGRSFARVLRDGGRGVTDGRQRHRARNVLVAGQLALAVVLLVGSGLMVRSFQRLRAVHLGVSTGGVTAVTVSWGDTEDVASAADFYLRVVEELRAEPSVASVGATNSLPLRPDGLNGGSFRIESRPRPEDQLPPVSMWSTVSPGFFETLGIPILEGRPMTDGDTRGEPPYVWVNERFARDFLDGAAVGERVQRGEMAETWWEIAGVVGDVRHFGPAEEVRPMMYHPLGPALPPNVSVSAVSVVVAGRGSGGAAVDAVRAVVARLGPEVPVTRARSMEAVRKESMADTSFTVALLGIAATVALLLGAVGVYGVISYVVSQRTREIGVRMALGARSTDVQHMVVRQGLAVTVLGVVVGLAGSFALTRLMAAILFEVSATDPLTFVVVPVALVAVSALACWIPARRAARVDPVRALVAE